MFQSYNKVNQLTYNLLQGHRLNQLLQNLLLQEISLNQLVVQSCLLEYKPDRLCHNLQQQHMFNQLCSRQSAPTPEELKIAMTPMVEIHLIHLIMMKATEEGIMEIKE